MPGSAPVYLHLFTLVFFALKKVMVTGYKPAAVTFTRSKTAPLTVYAAVVAYNRGSRRSK